MPRFVLRGARVVDGSGREERRADVLVDEGMIAAVDSPGVRQDVPAVDLDGLVLAPGFIDPHTHYDAQLLWDADATPSSWHGVTTVVTGNCGFGIAPTRPEHRSTMMRVLENVEGMPYDALVEGIPWTFETFPEYLDAIEARPLRLNVAALLGHTPLRYYVMGDDATEREATADEVASMRLLVDEGLRAGAVGFSTSRSMSHVGAYGRPVPSRAASLAELAELTEPMRERDAGYFEATWGPDFHVDEAAALAKHIGRPVSWAAIMANRREPGEAIRTAERVLEMGGPVCPQIACRPIVVQIAFERSVSLRHRRCVHRGARPPAGAAPRALRRSIVAATRGGGPAGPMGAIARLGRRGREHPARRVDRRPDARPDGGRVGSVRIRRDGRVGARGGPRDQVPRRRGQ